MSAKSSKKNKAVSKKGAGKEKARKQAQAHDPAAVRPGVPGPEPVPYEEPTEPREPLPPKADQKLPPAARDENLSQRGAYLTTPWVRAAPRRTIP